MTDENLYKLNNGITDDIIKHYESILNSLPNAIFICNLDMQIVFANTACGRIFNCNSEQIIGNQCSILNTKNCNTEECCIKRMNRGSAITYIDEANGYYLQVNISKLFDAKGNHIGYTSTSVDVTDLKKAEMELKISSQRFRVALPYTNCGIWEYDPMEKTLTRETASKFEFNIPDVTHNVPENFVKSGLVHKDSVNDVINLFKMLDDGVRIIEREIMLLTNTGEIQWYLLTFSNILNEKGVPYKAIGVSRNITPIKEIEQRYLQEHSYLDTLTADAISIFEVNLTKNIIFRTPKAAGASSFTLKKGEDACTAYLLSGDSWEIYHKDEEILRTQMNRKELLKAYKNGINTVSCEFRHVKSNEVFWINVTANIICPDDADVYAFISVKDIDLQKKKEEDLRKKATQDPLTGLLNRECAIERITGALANRDDTLPCAFYMMDIDFFKDINDRHGHIYGDEFLIKLAKVIKSVFRHDDILCRLGGDEFFAFVNEIDAENAVKKAEKVCKAVREMKADEDIEPTMSIGLYIADGNDISDLTFKDLYKYADLALYSAKNNGKNKFEIYKSNT